MRHSFADMNILYSHVAYEIHVHLACADFSIMFNWKRPQDMPITEPTEEQIWATIKAHDPHHSASIKDHLLWHQEMLEGRDMYEDCFARSPRIIPFESELPSGHNPTDWVISLNLRHSHDVPLEKVADRLSTGSQDVLQPVADSAPTTGIVRLLSYHILHRQAEDWDPRSAFGTPLTPVSGYTEWARYHLRVHHSVLKKAGIYQAIYASLFDYSRLPFTWIRGIAEHWDRTTNTCWIGPHELTMTLADIQDVAGLPIYGTPYEECIPPDHELFERQNDDHQRKGRFVYSSSLHRTLAHYQKLFKGRRGGRGRRGTITLDTWSESFLQKETCSAQYARLGDPFAVGTHVSETSFKQRFEPEGGISARHILARDMDDDTSLVAFIATWLCYFVFPSKSKLFRPYTLLMASLIARGKRIALAPAALAYLYHGLGQVSAMTDSRRYDVEAPWHYLHGWIYAHISGSFSCPETPPYFKEQHYPIIMQLSKATAAVNVAQIRTFMFMPSRMTDRFQITHQSQMQNLPVQSNDHHFVDVITEGNIPLLLSKPSYQGITEYFIGMRSSWLCYRRNESVVLKEYHPNRVARQFGFTQATPLYGLPQIPGIGDVRALGTSSLTIRLETAAMAWAYLFRLGTGSGFYIAPRCASTGVSHLWLMWIRHTFSSFLEMGFRVYNRRLGRPSHTEHVASTGNPSEREDSRRKRHRESASAHRSHQPAAYPGHGQKRRRSPSPPTRQSPIQNEPSPINEELHDDRRNTSVSHPDEVTAETAESARRSPPILIERSTPEPIESEPMPTSSAGISVASPIHYSNEPGIDGSMEEFEAVNVTDEPSRPSSIQGTTTNAPEETMATSPAEIGEQSSPHLENTLGPASGLEVSRFVSNICARSASFPEGRPSRSLNHIIAALRELLLDVNIEALPELPSFCAEANSLLDCAATTGLAAHELQQWESTLRNIEFGLFSVQIAQESVPSETTEYAEAMFNDTSEKATTAYENFQSRLKVMKAYQREVSRANMETLYISSELRKLQLREQYLIQRRDMIKRAVAAMEEDCSQIDTQVSELEQTFAYLFSKQETASQRLQYIREEHGFKAIQAQAAILYIKEIQAKYM